MLDICTSTLDKDVLEYKINKLARKINYYYYTLELNAVDIPDFMKPSEQQRENLVKSHINRLLAEGSIDFWYFKLLEEEDNRYVG